MRNLRRTLRVLLAASLAVAWLGAPASARAEDYAVIVNAENPTEPLDRLAVKKAFLMKSSRWKSGVKVRPIDRIARDAARIAFLEDVLRMEPQDLKRYWIQVRYQRALSPPTQAETEAEVLRFVAEEAGAIGFVRHSTAKSAKGTKVVLRY